MKQSGVAVLKAHNKSSNLAAHVGFTHSPRCAYPLAAKVGTGQFAPPPTLGGPLQRWSEPPPAGVRQSQEQQSWLL